MLPPLREVLTTLCFENQKKRLVVFLFSRSDYGALLTFPSVFKKRCVLVSEGEVKKMGVSSSHINED